MKNGQDEYASTGELDSVDDERARLAAAALATAQARDGALVDGGTLLKLNSRHLLADDDKDNVNGGSNSNEAPNAGSAYATHRQRRSINNGTHSGSNGTAAVKANVNGMDLVFINGTWHVVDLSICQQVISTNQTAASHHQHRDQYFNLTHLNRLVIDRL